MSDTVLVEFDNEDPEVILVEVFEDIGAPGPEGPTGPVDTAYSDEFKDAKVHGKKFDHRLRNYEIGKVQALKETGNLVTVAFYDSIGALGGMNDYHNTMYKRYGSGTVSNASYPYGWTQNGGALAFWSYGPNRITVADAVFNSTTTITSATAGFVASDKYRFITGTGIPAGAFITNVNSSTNITISVATTTTGTGKTITIAGPGQGSGIDGYASVMNSGEYMSTTRIVNNQTLRIFFDGAGPGTFRVSVAGVDIGVSVDITSGTYVHGTMKYYDVTVAAFFQDIRITCTSGQVRILGTYWFSDIALTSGDVVHYGLYHSGTKTADWNGFDKFQAFLQWALPHAVFTDMFINDDGDGATAYGNEITTMVNAIRASTPKTDIIWVGTHGTLNHNNAADLHTKLKNKAYTLDFFHIDMYEAMGDYTTANAAGLIGGDHVHLTALGSAVLSNIMIGVLEGTEHTLTDYIKTDSTNSLLELNFGAYDDAAPAVSRARMQVIDFSGWSYILFKDVLGTGGGGASWILYQGDPTVPSTSTGNAAGQFAARMFEIFQNRTSFVRTITTANITLSGLQTINGYTTVAGDWVLVKNQSTASQNGLYIAASGAWARAVDMSTNNTVSFYTGKEVMVLSGNAAGQKWYCTNTAIFTVGTTALNFSQAIPNGVPFANLTAPVASYDFNAQKLINLGADTLATSAAVVKQAKGAQIKSTYYTSPEFITQSTAAFTLGNLVVVAFFLATARSVAAIGCDMTVAASAGGKVRFVAYADAGLSASGPSAVVWNGAQIATDVATGWIEDTAVSGTTFPAGWNFVGLVNQVAAATWRSITQMRENLPASSPGGASTPCAWLTTGVTSAAGPSPWVSTSQAASAPLVKIKFT